MDQVSVQRAVAEFHAGRPVLIEQAEGLVLAGPVELAESGLAADIQGSITGALRLAISHERVATLNLPVDGPASLPLPPGVTASALRALAGGPPLDFDISPRAASPAEVAAIELAKLAQMVPAVLVGAAAKLAFPWPLVTTTAAAVLDYRRAAVADLRLVSRARVPLPAARESEFVVFRDRLGRNSAAVIVGRPDLRRPVPVRLHSACLTGDAFSSLRCDCGDQLRMAVAAMSSRGGGVLLYLDQEGCGIGLANKMRAYRLQDLGLDTIDANTTLGFQKDERRYDAAARMLALLGVDQVLLLTNNPAKLGGLREAGIDIAGRIPLIAPVTAENRRYLAAKAARVGHMLDAEAEPAPLADRAIA